MEEQWRKIEFGNGLYEVSNKGRVRSWKKMGVHGGKDKEPHLLSIYKHRTGYDMVALRDGADTTKHKRVHRLVAKAFIPNTDNKPHINHKNSIRDDNRVENLEWCTPTENMRHASENGRLNPWCGKGSELGTSKLDEESVSEIKIMLRKGIVAREIAEKFNVSRSTIKEINRGATWTHVPWPNKKVDKIKKTCPSCDKKFTPHISSKVGVPKKYCSIKCRRKYNNAKRQPKREAV